MKKAAPQILADRVKNSDYRAFKLLFDDFWEGMYSYASSLIMNDMVAKDMVQDIWLDYWKRRQIIQTHSIKSFLYSALRNRCYKYLRDNTLNITQLEVLQAISTPSEVEENTNFIATKRTVENIIDSLPNRCQEIFRLSRVQGVHSKDIAERLNISQRSVENQLSHALGRLRKELAIARNFFFSL